jgi:hypothetical protein
MWEPRRPTILWVSTFCYGDSFPFRNVLFPPHKVSHDIVLIGSEVLTAMVMKNPIWLNTTRCGPLQVNGASGEICTFLHFVPMQAEGLIGPELNDKWHLLLFLRERNFVSRLYTKCGSLDATQPCGPPCPDTGIALLYFTVNSKYLQLFTFLILHWVLVTLGVI